MSAPERDAGTRNKQARSGGLSGIGREKVTEIQRARILSAMTEVAAERGAANATVAHVVARSGVSRRTFYELFEDREACFMAAFEEAAARIAARMTPAYRGEAQWRGRMRGGLAALLDFLDEEPQTGRLCVVETLAAGPSALARRSEVLEHVKRAVDAGRAEARGKPPPPMMAEGVVGAVAAVLHDRLAQPVDRKEERESFIGLLGPLMGMIVMPYLGGAAAARELERPLPPRPKRSSGAGRDPLRDLDMRLTYRTVRVLMATAQHPEASNRALAQAAGVADQGQISKLLSRLRTLGLIENVGRGPVKGEPNAWRLTSKGQRVGQAIQTQTQG